MALRQIKERGALPGSIVVISVGNRPLAISGLHCRALVRRSVSGKSDSLIAKFKEAGGTVREIDVWARVTAIISALVICIIVCLSWAVNHYRDSIHYFNDKNAGELL